MVAAAVFNQCIKEQTKLRNITLPPVKQEEQPFREPLSWRFPEPPAEDVPRFPPNFELRTPTTPESVRATCGASSVRVEAQRALLGTGDRVQTADVTLGGCAATGEDPEAQTLIFESELQNCGSQLLVMFKWIYTFIRIWYLLFLLL